MLGPEGKARGGGHVPSVPNGNHIGGIDPKNQTMPMTFFWVKELSNVFSTFDS